MGILDDVKSVASIVQQIDNIELYRQILDLQAEVMEVVEENNNLKTDIKELKNNIKKEKSLVFENNFYWQKEEDGEKIGPFCSSCWDGDKKLIRMRKLKHNHFGCPACGGVLHSDGSCGSTITTNQFRFAQFKQK